ncbi:MAG TPA: hypothetical protein VM680_15830 [Verrucomicrobiae bacterium]|nr:hypothetical protein [Verrucomicrobiae bacterium]
MLATALLAGVATASAVTFNAGEIGDLDHHLAASWGISYQVPAGYKITSATLTIKNIWDWKQENDALFIHLLDDPKANVQYFTDNTTDTVILDYFAGQGRLLTTWSDPLGGVSRNFDLVYNFTAGDINVLNGYLADTKASGNGDFGFGFDPDCHYYNDGISFVINTAKVPEGGSTLAFLGVAMLMLGRLAPRRVLALAKR